MCPLCGTQNPARNIHCQGCAFKLRASAEHAPTSSLIVKILVGAALLTLVSALLIAIALL